MTSDGVAAVGIMQYSTTRERAAVEPSGNRVELFRHDARNVLHDCVMPRSSFWGSANLSSCTLIELSGMSNDEILRIRFV